MTLSICIPSYNRPTTLKRLLESIDSNCKDDLEIVICEDNSPKRIEIRKVVTEFKSKNSFNLKYIENKENYGYDRNLRELISAASGEYIMYMGDDDYILKENLSKYIKFIKDNSNCGYILKTWINLHENGWKETFNYFGKTKYFESSSQTIISIFRISTFISGFTIKRKECLPFLINDFDGTLLYQLYILGEVAYRNPVAFCDIPISIQTVEKADIPHFGSSKAEQNLYTPGVITVDNSINFLQGYFKISKYLDKKHNLNLTEGIRLEMSKNSYSFFVLQRDKGVKTFYYYFKRLSRDVKLNNSVNFYLYFIILLILGVNLSNKLVFFLKKIIKKTPLA